MSRGGAGGTFTAPPRSARMTLIGLLIALIIIGVVFWAVGQIPMAPPVRVAVVVVVALIVVVWLLTGGAGLHGLRIS